MTTPRMQGIRGHGGEPTEPEGAGASGAAAQAGQPLITVASIPAAHPYVQQVTGPGVVVLPDPPVDGAPAGQWWPPVALDAAWIRAHAETFDLMHVHFGTEARSIEQLEAVAEALRDVDRPLVFTAHDLEHPHLADQAHYRAQLEVLMAGAGAVLTLTDHAAAEIERRFGVTAQVVPHPQLAPDAWFDRADRLRLEAVEDRPVVALHLRDLRANVRPGPWLLALAEAAELIDVALRIYVNDRPGRDQTSTDLIDGLLGSVAGIEAVEILRRPRPTDDDLALELATAAVSVLPYAHGTHSGWLELCWDLGTKVLAPDVGALAGQHREPWFMRTFAAARPAELAHHLQALLAAPPAPPGAERLRARRLVARANSEAHRDVYGRLAGEAVATGEPGSH